MQTEIRNEWIYEASPNEIWEYLTQPELIALWLMPNNFVATPGQEFQFTTKPIPSLNLDGIMYCKVLDMVPLEKLIYSWKAGPGNGIFTLDTIVEWTLVPFENGTKLLLKQTGFKEENLSIFTGMTSGWQSNVVKMMGFIKNNKNANTKS